MVCKGTLELEGSSCWRSVTLAAGPAGLPTSYGSRGGLPPLPAAGPRAPMRAAREAEAADEAAALGAVDE